VTTGDDLACILQFLDEGHDHYAAATVVHKLLSKLPESAQQPAPEHPAASQVGQHTA
jgi:hypothetical protein